jgi:hypothetical protein
LRQLRAGWQREASVRAPDLERRRLPDVRQESKKPGSDATPGVFDDIEGERNHPRRRCDGFQFGRSDTDGSRDDIKLDRNDIEVGRNNIQFGRDKISAGRNDNPDGCNDIPAGRTDIPVGRNEIQVGRNDIEGDGNEIKPAVTKPRAAAANFRKILTT